MIADWSAKVASGGALVCQSVQPRGLPWVCRLTKRHFLTVHHFSTLWHFVIDRVKRSRPV